MFIKENGRPEEENELVVKEVSLVTGLQQEFLHSMRAGVEEADVVGEPGLEIGGADPVSKGFCDHGGSLLPP